MTDNNIQSAAPEQHGDLRAVYDMGIFARSQRGYG